MLACSLVSVGKDRKGQSLVERVYLDFSISDGCIVDLTDLCFIYDEYARAIYLFMLQGMLLCMKSLYLLGQSKIHRLL